MKQTKKINIQIKTNDVIQHIKELIQTDNEENIKLANKLSKIIGFEDGLTATFFEYLIQEEGLTMENINVIAVYYKMDITFKGVSK